MRLTPWQTAVLRVGELYCVGGAIRDALFGVAPDPAGRDDVDYLVRKIPPDELEKILRLFGRIQLVGKSFGVFKFKPSGAPKEIDIAYPRKETSTGPGHRDFDVDWDWELPLEEDLVRRDFTINAIAQSVKDGSMVDPCGGANDIHARVLRMVFPGTFRDDPLRILRGVRFTTRFALTIEDETLAAMTRNAKLVDTISTERIQDELTKLLVQCERPSEGFALMHDIGVLPVVLPELERTYGVTQNEHHPDDVFWHSVKSCDAAPGRNLVVRWAALLHDLGKVNKKQVVTNEAGEEKTVFYGHERDGAVIAARLLRRLRYSNDFIRRVVHLVEHHMFFYRSEWTRASVRRFIRRVGAEEVEDLFLLRRADCLSRDKTDELEPLEELRDRIALELKEERAFKIADLAINGTDVIDVLGVTPGPDVGRILDDLLELVLDKPELNKTDTLRNILKEKFS